MKQKKKCGNLGEIKKELERRLIVLRYSDPAARQYMRIFGWVQDYLAGYGEADYSKEAGRRFLAEYRLQRQHAPTVFKNAKTLVRRLDEILEGKQFAPRFCEPKEECPSRFLGWRDRYFEYLRNRGLVKSSISNHERHVRRFLGRLPESVRSLEDLSAADIYGVFAKYEPRTGAIPVTRCFLVFLFENGATKADLSICVPRLRQPRPMPSVYSGDEISRLLASVDRATAMGKRDYAVLMLASRLGLRSSDIVNLSLKDIDRLGKTIDIVQVKTGYPLTLVLNSDVEEALNNYIADGRPQSSSEKIFLGSQAPFNPLTPSAAGAIAHRYFKLANIAPQGRQMGSHALRMSYATALVTKGVPYSVVQKALGHNDPSLQNIMCAWTSDV